MGFRAYFKFLIPPIMTRFYFFFFAQAYSQKWRGGIFWASLSNELFKHSKFLNNIFHTHFFSTEIQTAIEVEECKHLSPSRNSTPIEISCEQLSGFLISKCQKSDFPISSYWHITSTWNYYSLFFPAFFNSKNCCVRVERKTANRQQRVVLEGDE